MVIVLGVMLVLLALAAAALYLMTSQSRIAEGKVKRMRAYYAAQAGMVYALEEAWNNTTVWVPNIAANTSFSVTPALAIGAGIDGYPAGGYNPAISVTPGAGIDNTSLVSITVSY